MPIMQDIRQSDWFYKLIASCWNPLLPYFFCCFFIELKEQDFMRILYLFVKAIISFYSFVTCLLIIFSLFITISIN